MAEQLVIMTMYPTPAYLDTQNKKLQDLIDQGWRIVDMVPGGGGGTSEYHSMVFLLEYNNPADQETSRPSP